MFASAAGGTALFIVGVITCAYAVVKLPAPSQPGLTPHSWTLAYIVGLIAVIFGVEYIVAPFVNGSRTMDYGLVLGAKVSVALYITMALHARGGQRAERLISLLPGSR